MQPRTVAVLCGLTFLAAIGEARAADAGLRPESAAARVHVDVDRGTVTLRVRDVALEDLVETLARSSGLEVDVHGSLAGRVTLELDAVPVPEALRRLLSGHNFALRYVDSPPARSGTVWVFSRRSTPGGAAAGRSPAAGSELIEAYARLARRRPALADDDRKVRLAAVTDLAASCREPARSEGPGRDAASKAEVVEALAAIALFDDDAAMREEAVYGLGAGGDEVGLQILERALGDLVRRVRRAAVEAIAEAGGDGSAWALAAALRDEDASLREQAVYALGDVGGAAAVTVLRQALADEQGFVREAAKEVLRQLTGED